MHRARFGRAHTKSVLTTQTDMLAYGGDKHRCAIPGRVAAINAARSRINTIWKIKDGTPRRESMNQRRRISVFTALIRPKNKSICCWLMKMKSATVSQLFFFRDAQSQCGKMMSLLLSVSERHSKAAGRFFLWTYDSRSPWLSSCRQTSIVWTTTS